MKITTLSKILKGFLISISLSCEVSLIVNAQSTPETKYRVYRVNKNTAGIHLKGFEFQYINDKLERITTTKYPVIFFFGKSQKVYIPYLDSSQTTDYYEKNREYAGNKGITLWEDYLYAVTETGIKLQIKPSTISAMNETVEKPEIEIKRDILWFSNDLSNHKYICNTNGRDDNKHFKVTIPIDEDNEQNLNEWTKTFNFLRLQTNEQNTQAKISVDKKTFTENNSYPNSYPEFRRYEITHNKTGNVLIFFAHIVRNCENHMIKKVKIKEYTENDWQRPQNYDISHATEDRDLRDSTSRDEDLMINSENDHKYYHNGYTYLYSVNNVEQYNNLIKYLKRQRIYNKVLANFLISEFNITCWSGKRSLCEKHDYSEDEF